MGITNKTRKILWAKSGGKCAICRIDLAHSDRDDKCCSECFERSTKINT